jgi:hypothetical protein
VDHHIHATERAVSQAEFEVSGKNWLVIVAAS